MVKAAKKIAFSRSRDIPFNKLVLSASNVRRTPITMSTNWPKTSPGARIGRGAIG
jgi:hypothetical protein